MTLIRRAPLKLALALTIFLVPLSAQALPGIGFSAGLVGGFGTGYADFGDLPEPDVDYSLSAFGLGATLKVIMIEAEVDLLYHTTTITGDNETNDFSYLAIPIIARLDISPIPLLSLAIGGGIENRFFLSQSEEGQDDLYESSVLYMPLSLKAGLSIPGVGLGVTAEARYSHQLGALLKEPVDEVKIHNTMFFFGVTF